MDFFSDSNVIAVYRQRRLFAGAEAGVNTSRTSELSGGFRIGHLDADVQAGDPGLPSLSGLETLGRIQWLHDGQDHPAVPSGGTRARAYFVHYLQSPEATGSTRTNDGLNQAEATTSTFWTYKRRNRLFLVLGGGTSFDGSPLATAQFNVGFPFRLDAFGVGERRGDHYAVVTGGFLRQLGRLPDFMGGPIFAGVWLENGSAFDDPDTADVNTHTGVGVVLDTLLGPLLIGAGVGIDGGWRTFIGVGRIFQ